MIGLEVILGFFFTGPSAFSGRFITGCPPSRHFTRLPEHPMHARLPLPLGHTQDHEWCLHSSQVLSVSGSRPSLRVCLRKYDFLVLLSKGTKRKDKSVPDPRNQRETYL